MDKTELFEMLHDVIAVLEDEQNRAVKKGDYIWALKYAAMIGAVRDVCWMLTPRVLTVEELLETYCCWMEQRDAYAMYVSPVMYDKAHQEYTYAEMGRREPLLVKAEEYGKTWRCWNMEPDDEQMRETEWKDGHEQD